MVHIHLIFDRFVWKSKIWMSWYKVTGSLCIRISYRKKGEAVRYVLKYLVKSQKQDNDKWAFLFKNVDRIWSSSRGFFVNVELPISDWVFLALAWNRWNILDTEFGYKENITSPHKYDPERSYTLVDSFFWNECIISTGSDDIFRILKAEFEEIPF